MRKVCLMFLCLILTVNSFGAPLIFKIKKEVLEDKETEIAKIDTSKYQEIRFILQYENKTQTKKPPYLLDLIIHAVEGDENIEFDSFSLTNLTSTSKRVYFEKVYNSPPAKLAFSATIKGTYWLYVWGQ